MARRATLRLAIFLVSLMTVSVAFAQPAHRPLDEMRGGCSEYSTDVRAELAAMEGPVREVNASTDHSATASLSPTQEALSVHLHHAGRVELAAAPRKAASSYAGILPFSVPYDGPYRISAASPVWIEVLTDKAPVEPLAFEMQTSCHILFKSVEYDLLADRRYWVELSANSATVTILLTRR